MIATGICETPDPIENSVEVVKAKQDLRLIAKVYFFMTGLCSSIVVAFLLAEVAMFDLKKPCKSCPFLKVNGERFGLCRARLDEIFSAPAFQCHATVDYSEDIEGNETHGQGDNPQQCKGLMSLLAYENQPNQIMQVAERFGECSVESHKCDGTYQTFQEAIEAHAK